MIFRRDMPLIDKQSKQKENRKQFAMKNAEKIVISDINSTKTYTHSRALINCLVAVFVFLFSFLHNN